MKKVYSLILIVVCVIAGCSQVATKTTALQYPKTEKIEHHDTYHGIRVSDPYQWLEEEFKRSMQDRWQILPSFCSYFSS